MKNINNLPKINPENIGQDVLSSLATEKIIFKTVEEAPWFLKQLSKTFNEPYFAYKKTIYVPVDHIILAKSENNDNKFIANAKLIPWVYAINNGSVSSLLSTSIVLLNEDIRIYYYIFEIILINSYNPVISKIINTKFFNSRKTIWGTVKNSDKLIQTLTRLSRDKIHRI